MVSSETHTDQLTGLATIYVNKFQDDPEGTLNFLSKYSVPLEIMVMVYNSLLRTNEIKAVEDIDEEMKLKLWNQSIHISENKHTRVKLCKAIWLINFILEK